MQSRWDPPPFLASPSGDGGRWTRPPVVGPSDVVRVVLHGTGNDLWLDPVYGTGAPTIQVVSAGQVARTALFGQWCWMVGHRVGNLKVVEGSPVGDGDATALIDPDTTVRLKQTDGVSQLFVLEARTHQGCRVCGAVDRDQPDRGDGMARLFPSPRAALPPRPGTSWWVRLRTPWNPWGPIRGLYFSPLAPLSLLAVVVVLLVDQAGPLALPQWPLLAVWMIPADILLSTIGGYIRDFLERCGARFDQPEPFGRHPGGQPLLALEAHNPKPQPG